MLSDKDIDSDRTTKPKSVLIGEYLLFLALQEFEPELITHLRLQKLLYYVQAWHLAACDAPIFDEPIQAWIHGPVAVQAYPAFADFGSDPIPPHRASNADALSHTERGFIQSVWGHYKQYSATQLCSMTHSEDPFIVARAGLPADQPSRAEIDRGRMRDYFRKEYARATTGWEGLSVEDFEAAQRDRDLGRTVKLSA